MCVHIVLCFHNKSQNFIYKIIFKDAEERRKKMREMMAAKKRAISASALQETSTNFL